MYVRVIYGVLPSQKCKNLHTQVSLPAIEPVLDRILKSGIFGASERQPALLRYLVTEELSGRGENLKAYTIGTDVLGRGARFDPGQDAIVRVEIGRLRKSLELYFATTGRDDPIQIIIEKGNYRPQFICEEERAPEPAHLAALSSARNQMPRNARQTARRFWAWLALSAVAVSAIAALAAYMSLDPPSTDPLAEESPQLIIAQPDTTGLGEKSESLRFGLQAALAQELRTRTWLSVALGGAATTPKRPTFTLKPALSIYEDDRWTMTTVLMREPEREVVWTGRYDGQNDLFQPDALRTAIAAAVNRDLGPLTGPIGDAVALQSEATSPIASTPFSCIVNARRFLRHNHKRQFVDAKACAARHLEATPTLIEMRAILAYLLILEATQPNLSAPPLVVGGTFVSTREARRDALMNEADSLQRGASPSDRIMLQQRLVLAACKGNFEVIRENMPALLAFRSNIADTHIVRAVLLGPMLGEWASALEAEARALSMTAHPAPRYQIVSGLKAAMEEAPVEALRQLTRVPMHSYPLGHLLVGLFAAEAGAPLHVRSARNNLTELGYREEKALDDMISDSCYSDDVKARLRRALRTYIDFKLD